MRDSDRLRAMKASSTDPDWLEREARMAEAKQMTVLEIMAKAARLHMEDTWDEAGPEEKRLYVESMRSTVRAIRGWPLANIAIEVGKHIDMRPADVDLVLTAAIDAILAEKSK